MSNKKYTDGWKSFRCIPIHILYVFKTCSKRKLVCSRAKYWNEFHESQVFTHIHCRRGTWLPILHFNYSRHSVTHMMAGVHGRRHCSRCCCPGLCYCVWVRLTPDWASDLWVKNRLQSHLQTTAALLVEQGNCLWAESSPPVKTNNHIWKEPTFIKYNLKHSYIRLFAPKEVNLLDILSSLWH